MSGDEEISLLPWMTNDLFQQVLDKYESRSVVLKDYKVTSGTKKGENFAASIFRAHLDYEFDGTIKSTTFILKASSANELISEFLADVDVYKSESFFYTHILAECDSMLKAIGDHTKFSPRFDFSFDLSRPIPFITCYIIYERSPILFLFDLSKVTENLCIRGHP